MRISRALFAAFMDSENIMKIHKLSTLADSCFRVVKVNSRRKFPSVYDASKCGISCEL